MPITPAEAVILRALPASFRAWPSCRKSRGGAPPASLADSFVLVDPLDGTRELIAGRDEFTVNVAIVTGGHPAARHRGGPGEACSGAGIEGRR